MWAWLKRLYVNDKKQTKIIAKAREVMGNMENWQEYAGKPANEIVLVLMNIGLGYVEALYRAGMVQQQSLFSKKAHLN